MWFHRLRALWWWWLPLTLVHVRGGRKGERWRGMEEFERRRRWMVQPSQQHIAPCVKGVDWESGSRDLRITPQTIVLRGLRRTLNGPPLCRETRWGNCFQSRFCADNGGVLKRRCWETGVMIFFFFLKFNEDFGHLIQA